MGKLVQRRKAHPERAQAPFVASPRRRTGNLTTPARSGSGIRRQVDAEEIVGESGAHEGAGSDPTFEVALVQQLIVRRKHRKARHGELQGQVPGRRDPVAGAEQAIENGSPDCFVDLAVERDAGEAVDSKGQSGHDPNVSIGDGDSTAFQLASVPPSAAVSRMPDDCGGSDRLKPNREDAVTDTPRHLRICLLVCGLAVALQSLPALAQSPPGAARPSVPGALKERDGQHDFDFEIGTWKTRLSRLLHPLTGSTAWVRYEGTSIVRKVWNGRANLVELQVDGPAGHIEALSLRLYNPQSRQWSLNFSNSKGGTLAEPSIGKFTGGRGEFFSQESLDGRAILVRFVISVITPDSCRFEQSFSADGGKTWEPNWIAIDTRVKEVSEPAP